MKKLLLGLSAILLCFMMASCGDSSTSKDKDKDKDEKVENNKDPLGKLQSLSEDIKKNGNSWTDTEKWDEVFVDSYNCIIDFAESDYSKEEYEKFKKAAQEVGVAMLLIHDIKAEEAMQEAANNFDKNHNDLYKEFEKANKKLKKFEKDNDEEDDDVAPTTEKPAPEAVTEATEQVKQATEQGEEAAEVQQLEAPEPDF